MAAGYTVSDGNSGGNYIVTAASSTVGVINKAALTITALANTKTYDATTSAAAAPTVVGLQGSDTVTGLSETYDTKNAGTGKTLSVAAGYTVSDGNSGGNYTVTAASSTVGVINKAALTITALANTKTYDSTTSAAATPTVVGLVGSDTVTGLSETYDTKNAGTGKTLTVAAGYTVSDGNSGGNYTVTAASSTVGVINKAALTITAMANTKTFDGTTSAAATPTVTGLQGTTDTVTGLSETYDTSAVGSGKTLTVSPGYTVNDGNGGGNYNVTTVPNTNGVINSATAVSTTTSVTTSSGTVVYGTTVTFTAVVSANTGSVAPTQGNVDIKDTTTNTDFGNGTFVNSSGTNSTWTFTTGVKTFNFTTGDTIQAAYSGDAAFNGSNGSTTQIVNKAPLTITALSNTKTYDGTTSAAAAPTVVGLVGSDTVTGLSETYNSKNAGTGKTLSVAAGYTVSDGNSGGNYTVTAASSTVGVINKAP